MTTPMKELFESLDKRWTPEHVATLLPSILGDVPGPLSRTVSDVAGCCRRSYMREDFNRVRGMDRPLGVAHQLSGIEPPSGLDLEAIYVFIEKFEKTFGKTIGCNDFKVDRLNRDQRRAAGLGEISRRRYNRMFRLSVRMEKQQDKVAYELEKRSFTQMSKARMASKITWEEFSTDAHTAAFVAYYTARCNLRSRFTNQSQDQPYDKLCDTLFAQLDRRAETNWWVVALAYPVDRVLARLTDEQKGRLMGLWYNALSRLAVLLERTWRSSNINRETMIVRRGNDSSTWNTLAGAWNKARDAWINLLYAMEMEGVLDHQCPGKVLRLMAADVASWHRTTGGDLDPNTLVWCDVPLPWDVFSGRASCTKAEVRAICASHKLDPHKSGWTGPKLAGKVHPFRQTPELVHGVTIASPELGQMLRKAGVFSGQHDRSKPIPDHLVAVVELTRECQAMAEGPVAKGAKEKIEQNELTRSTN